MGVNGSERAFAQSDESHLAYLPMLLNRKSHSEPRPRAWGMQFAIEYDDRRHRENVEFELRRARNAGIGIVRTDLFWSKVEPQNIAPEEFDWHHTDQRLRNYADAGLDALLTVISYPRWAMEYGCGAGFHAGMEEEWQEFIRAAAERYSQAPYRVRAWEIGNEVDGLLTIDERDWARPEGWGKGEPTTPHGGCWSGREGEYAKFLRIAYQAIKAVDPDALVTHGGLAYVDPSLRPEEVQAVYPPDFDIDFMEKLLLVGGGEYFDFINYHWFPDYPWQPTPVQRHRKLMKVLAAYGYAKPAWLTETYRLSLPADRDSEMRQVEFLTRELVPLLAEPEIESVFWYGWVDMPQGVADQEGDWQRGIINRNRQPKLAFQVLKNLIQHSNGIPSDVSTDEVQAYRFDWPRSAQSHLIAWSKSGALADYEFEAPARARQGTLARVFTGEKIKAGECCIEVPIPVGENDRIRLQVGRDTIFLSMGSENLDD